jgi:hypothetical protein
MGVAGATMTLQRAAGWPPARSLGAAIVVAVCTAFVSFPGRANGASPWWWWTQEGAVRAAGTAFPTSPYWNVGCGGIGAHRFFNVAADWVRPNGTSPAIRTPSAAYHWKFQRFLCIAYLPKDPPLVFWLLPGAGEYDYELLPVATATNTLAHAIHNGR